MSSSGLIYAVIVGAWAVYLVPTWLRREEELNAARQTARFAGAIKVLAHREALERRVFARLDGTTGLPVEEPDASTASPPMSAASPVAPVAASVSAPASLAPSAPSRPRTTQASREAARRRDAGLRRGKLLMRRRRTVAMLLVAALGGAIATAILGVAYVGLTGVPGLLFVGYSFHIRHDERRRMAERERRRRADRPRRRQAQQLQQTPQPSHPHPAPAQTAPTLPAPTDTPAQQPPTPRRQRLIA